MSRFKGTVGVLILLISVFWISPGLAQSDRCGSDVETLTYGDTTEGRIIARERYGNHCFEGHAGDRVIINVQSHSNNPDANLFVALTDANWQLYDHTQSSAASVRLIYPLEKDGAYTISVALLVKNQELMGAYTLSLVRQDEEDREAAQEAAASKTLSPCPTDLHIAVPGADRQASISDETLFQAYCFVGLEDYLYRIQVKAISGDLDPIVTILSLSGDDLASNDNAQQDVKDAMADFIPEKDGIYTVFVTRKGVDEGTTTGDYRLSIENRTTGQPDRCPDAFAITLEGTVIDAEHSSEFYEFCLNATQDQPVTVTIEAQTGILNMMAVITDSHEAVLARRTTSADASFSLTAAPLEDGVLFIDLFDTLSQGGIEIYTDKPLKAPEHSLP